MAVPTRILIVDDDEPFRNLLRDRLTGKGHHVAAFADGPQALPAIRQEEFDVALLDIRLPGMDGMDLLKQLKEEQPALEVIMLTGHATVETAVEAMKRGAYDYLAKPLKLSELDALIQKAYDKGRLVTENVLLREELLRRTASPEIIGASPPIQHVQELIARVAASESPVLIQGESGVGKELVAQAIHRLSPRAGRSFIAVNCAAFAETLLENELFGHIRGAYTGATEARPGLFEVAHQGTLFIDEVGEMSGALQAKLLRVLDTGEFHRLGDPKVKRVDVRILSATNRDLREVVKAGHFREDLYFRLNVITITVPPLRERREDIPLLVRHFLDLRNRRAASGGHKGVSDEAVRVLTQYPWPGNVRELANVLERAFVLSAGRTITGEDIRKSLGEALTPPAGPSLESATLEELEREHIARMLRTFGGNRMRTAQALGISLRNLYRKIKRYGLTGSDTAARPA